MLVSEVGIGVPTMQTSSKTRVLIVDDDGSMARFLGSYLSRRNFEISTAASGEEAIRMFRVCDPSLVLLDVSMPGLNGIETLERIKQIKPEVAVIMLSGQQDPDSPSKLQSSAPRTTSSSPSRRKTRRVASRKWSSGTAWLGKSASCANRSAARATSPCCSAPARRWRK